MSKKSDVLKVVKEDVIRRIDEKKGGTNIEYVRSDSKSSKSYIDDAITELEKERMIRRRGDLITLTKRGKKRADGILRRYNVVENYFKGIKGDKKAKKIADILEHYISEEVVKNIKRLSTFKGKGIPITSLNMHDHGLLVDMDLSDGKLFERMASMGIFPGESIEIVGKIPNALILKVKNKRFALDEEIVKKFKVIRYEEN